METRGEGHLRVLHFQVIGVDVTGRNHAIALQIEGDILRKKDIETKADAGYGACFILNGIFTGSVSEEKTDEWGKSGGGAIFIDKNRIEKMVLDERGNLYFCRGCVIAIHTGKAKLQRIRRIVSAMELYVDFIAQQRRGFKTEGKSRRIGALRGAAPSKGGDGEKRNEKERDNGMFHADVETGYEG